MVGEIHLAKIYFTDASDAKIRPVLLLRANSFSDVIYLPLTTNMLIKGVSIDNDQLTDGYLPKTSIVVYEKPGVIAATLLIKKIRTLNMVVYRNIIDKLIDFLKTES